MRALFGANTLAGRPRGLNRFGWAFDEHSDARCEDPRIAGQVEPCDVARRALLSSPVGSGSGQLTTLATNMYLGTDYLGAVAGGIIPDFRQ